MSAFNVHQIELRIDPIHGLSDAVKPAPGAGGPFVGAPGADLQIRHLGHQKIQALLNGTRRNLLQRRQFKVGDLAHAWGHTSPAYVLKSAWEAH